MSEHERELSGAERELEEALASLTPSPVVNEAGEILFRAGFEAGRRRVRGLSCLSGALAAALALSLFLRPGPQIQERVVLVHEQPAPRLRQAAAPDTRLVMHEFPLERADWWSRLNHLWTATPNAAQRESYFGLEAHPADTTARSAQTDSPLIRQLRMKRTLGVDPADVGGTYRIHSQTSSGERAL